MSRRPVSNPTLAGRRKHELQTDRPKHLKESRQAREVGESEQLLLHLNEVLLYLPLKSARSTRSRRFQGKHNVCADISVQARLLAISVYLLRTSSCLMPPPPNPCRADSSSKFALLLGALQRYGKARRVSVCLTPARHRYMAAVRQEGFGVGEIEARDCSECSQSWLHRTR